MNAADQFELIVQEHYEPLFRFAISLTRSESDAWDLTQQTFYIWATKGHQLRELSKVKTWLFTTLHRAFLQGRRRQISFPEQDLDEVAEQLPAPSPVLANQLDSSQVLIMLAKVDEVYQAAVALYYLDDLSYKEIAEILDVPVGTVKSRVARGVAQLRDFLTSDGLEISAMRKPATSSVSETDGNEAPITNLLVPGLDNRSNAGVWKRLRRLGRKFYSPLGTTRRRVHHELTSGSIALLKLAPN